MSRKVWTLNWKTWTLDHKVPDPSPVHHSAPKGHSSQEEPLQTLDELFDSEGTRAYYLAIKERNRRRAERGPEIINSPHWKKDGTFYGNCWRLFAALLLLSIFWFFQALDWSSMHNICDRPDVFSYSAVQDIHLGLHYSLAITAIPMVLVGILIACMTVLLPLFLLTGTYNDRAEPGLYLRFWWCLVAGALISPIPWYCAYHNAHKGGVPIYAVPSAEQWQEYIRDHPEAAKLYYLPNGSPVPYRPPEPPSPPDPNVAPCIVPSTTPTITSPATGDVNSMTEEQKQKLLMTAERPQAPDIHTDSQPPDNTEICSH
jgi:hypothetical protein